MAAKMLLRRPHVITGSNDVTSWRHMTTSDTYDVTVWGFLGHSVRHKDKIQTKTVQNLDLCCGFMFSNKNVFVVFSKTSAWTETVSLFPLPSLHRFFVQHQTPLTFPAQGSDYSFGFPCGILLFLIHCTVGFSKNSWNLPAKIQVCCERVIKVTVLHHATKHVLVYIQWFSWNRCTIW